MSCVVRKECDFLDGDQKRDALTNVACGVAGSVELFGTRTVLSRDAAAAECNYDDASTVVAATPATIARTISNSAIQTGLPEFMSSTSAQA
jgi:hypothetical protein